MRVCVGIAGAGPAGIATAVALVRRGIDPADVCIFERGYFPKEKPCGGGLTGHAAQALEALGLTVRVAKVACTKGRMVYGWRRADVVLERPVEVVRREDFDADLVAQARDLGVSICEGEGLEDFRVEPDRVLVRTTRGREVAAQVLVGADGVGSLVRRRLLTGCAQQPMRLCRLEIPTPRGWPFSTRMIYDFSAMADGLRGYVWIFPAPGQRLNVGAMHFPASPLGGRDLNLLLGRTLTKFGLTLAKPARGWPAWPYDARVPLSVARVLLVGDAAGIDALTGEGIAVALDHGMIAAKAIADAEATRDFAFADYSTRVRRALVGRELALDGVLAHLLYQSTDPLPWLALALEDEGVRTLYARRVSGSHVLADEKPALLRAVGKHVFLGAGRMRQLQAAARSPLRWSAP